MYFYFTSCYVHTYIDTFNFHFAAVDQKVWDVMIAWVCKAYRLYHVCVKRRNLFEKIGLVMMPQQITKRLCKIACFFLTF